VNSNRDRTNNGPESAAGEVFPRPLRVARLIPAFAAALISLGLISFCDKEFFWFYDILKALPLDEFFSTTKQLAATTSVAAIALSVWLLDPPKRRAVIVLLVAMFVAWLPNEVLKRSTGRSRPEYSVVMEPDNAKKLQRYIDEHPNTTARVQKASQWLLFKHPRPWQLDAFTSFPSGHANTAFVLLAFLIAAYPRGRWVWVILSVGCALARVRYRRHFPSDVLFGGALGWAMAQWVFSWQWPAHLAAKWIGPRGEWLGRGEEDDEEEK